MNIYLYEILTHLTSVISCLLVSIRLSDVNFVQMHQVNFQQITNLMEDLLDVNTAGEIKFKTCMGDLRFNEV